MNLLTAILLDPNVSPEFKRAMSHKPLLGSISDPSSERAWEVRQQEREDDRADQRRIERDGGEE